MPFSFLALSFPDIDPILVEFGVFAVRWYSLAYIAGILLGWLYITKLDRVAAGYGMATLGKKTLDDVVTWVVIGIILGGRLGYVLFYQPEYYLHNPMQALKIWQGGMSFHGGFLGVLIATYLFCKKHQLGFFKLMDLFACAAPIGLFFGRIANFINGELYGNITNVPWAFVFPDGGPLPRHPSQLYEAALEGLVLFAIMARLAYKYHALRFSGLLSGAFLLGYGLSRIMVEFVREPDEQLGYLLGEWFTMGMLLSLPMVFCGIGLIYVARKKTTATYP